MKSPNRTRLEALIEAGKADPSAVFEELSQMARELLEQAEPTLYPRELWDENDGECLWFLVKPDDGHPCEPPVVGRDPDMGDAYADGTPAMPGYVTHWTHLPHVTTIASAGEEKPAPPWVREQERQRDANRRAARG